MTEPSSHVRELLHRMTPAERLSLLHQRQPALPRLGLGASHTGSELLHGVAWSGRATVFCQAVGLGATWDPGLVHRVGQAVGTEARAMHHLDPAVGLNAWAPVVNPLRHPGWGRNEEGYGEDPRLVADLAIAYAGGLKGDHPRLWRVTPTLKHLCAYNTEDHRDVVSVQVPPRVLHEYELPVYLEPVAAGVVAAVMPSYNLVNGRAAHLSADLIEAVRAASPGSLAVVSDAYAPGNVFRAQRPGLDPVEASALVLRAGVDSFTEDGPDPAPTLQRLQEALERGLLSEADVTTAAARVLMLRELTGELGRELRGEDDPWAGLGADDVASSEHAELAREAATAAVVVLADPGRVLPLQGSVGVVGPMAGEVLTDWYSGTPPYRVSIADALAERDGSTPAAVSGDDTVLLRLAGPGPERWLGLDERAALRAGDHRDAVEWAWRDWGDGVLTLRAAPGLLTSPDGRALTADAERVGGWEVQESLHAEPHPDGTFSLLHLGTGRWLHARPDGVLEVGARTAERAARLTRTVLRSGLAEARAVAEQVGTVVVAVGNDPHLNGRETQDRPGLALPPAQAELVRALTRVHPRVVLVVVSSYPYVLTEDLAGLPVVWSSHGGQELGHAVVDVLTGAVEPRGRLPQPWPQHEEQVGELLDYDLQTSRTTSWWSPTAPRYALGHGLHYSTTGWDVVGAEVGPEEVVVGVRVTNTGDRPAPEVVQLYGRATGEDVPTPRRLLAHQRVDLAPGQSSEVRLVVPLSRLDLWDVTVDGWWRPGRHRLEVARSAAAVVQHLDVEVAERPRGRHRPSQRALRAECFDTWAGLELVATGDLRGHALRARDAGRGTASYTRVEAAGAETLVLRCRRASGSAAGRSATVTARLRPGAGVEPEEAGPEAVTCEPPEDGEVLLAVPVPSGAADGELVLEVTLTGSAELLDVTGPTPTGTATTA